MFESIISETLTLSSISICILVDIILGLFVSLIYMNTTKYSKNFVITLTLLPLLVSVVMIMVNGSLGTSIAILGAFGLIRFRTIPGTSQEIACVFWAMALGLSVGMGQIWFAVIVAVITGLLLLILSKTKFGEHGYDYKTMKITIPENLNYEDVFKEEFDKYLTRYELTKMKTTNLGSLYELTYNITFKKDVKEKEFIDELRVKNGNLKIVVYRIETNEML